MFVGKTIVAENLSESAIWPVLEIQLKTDTSVQTDSQLTGLASKPYKHEHTCRAFQSFVAPLNTNGLRLSYVDLNNSGVSLATSTTSSWQTRSTGESDARDKNCISDEASGANVDSSLDLVVGAAVAGFGFGVGFGVGLAFGATVGLAFGFTGTA